MSKFHSTVSRRDFMKGLGLAGAGLGAAAAAAPVFHDVDELTSSTTTHPYHRWWVKERDYEDITTPVDWSVFKAYDWDTHPGTPREFGPMGPVLSAERNLRQSRGAIHGWPGSSVRDLALNSATGGNRGSTSWDGAGGKPPYRYEADGQVAVPWTGTPEENLQTFRAAAHFYGSPRAGCIEVNEHMKRLLEKDSCVWEDIDEAYRDDDRVYHMPNKCNRILVWQTKQNYEMTQYVIRCSPDDPWPNKVFRHGKAGENMAYDHAPFIRYYINRFVKSLGYQTLKPSGGNWNVAHGCFAGLNEMGRAAMILSPSYGMMVRYNDFIFTDFNVAPTKPIDAGIRNFCRVCARCADVCPSDSQNKNKEPSWDVVNPQNNAGLETWYLNWDPCVRWGGPWDCINCQVVCPFNHGEDAIIHPIVRAVVGTTSVFNSFFATLEDSFGYWGQKSAEEFNDWWTRDLSTWPYDTLLGFGIKGWY